MLSRFLSILMLYLLAFTFSSTGLVLADEGLARDERLFATIEYPDWYLSEPVSFAIRNHTSKTIILASTSPWCIRDAQGNKVYTPHASDVIIHLQPKEKMRWVWDQRDTNGYQVKAGEYVIEFDDHDISVSFVIKQQLGSRGFFTFDVAGESLRLFLSDPESVRAAIENYYGMNQNSIPIGELVDDRPGKSPYDAQWSWHMVADSISMAQLTIELCDARPSDVETNLDYWLTAVRQYCPWSSRIVALH